MKIKFKKISPKAQKPDRAHPTDAGWDLKAVSGLCNTLVGWARIKEEII